MSAPFDRLWAVVNEALAVENRHGSDPGEVATMIASLACLIAKNSGVRGGALVAAGDAAGMVRPGPGSGV